MPTLKKPEEIEVMAEGGRRLALVLKQLQGAVAVGVTTKQLDEMAFDLIKKASCAPAFLGYQPEGAKKAYPATICASVNDGVVHGLPSKYKLQSGDVLKLDIGLVHEGWYLDMAITVPVGDVSEEAKKLIAVTAAALQAGIEQARVGKTLGDIGAAIQSRATQAGFAIAETLTGHGIGHDLHEEPYVFNTGPAGRGEQLREGMVVAIEPMISAGGGRVRQLSDDSFVTADGSLAAHFEHTVAITKNGPQILTKLLD